MSTEWRLNFEQVGVLHLSNESSNHSPIQRKTYLDHLPRPRPFRFLEVWTLCEEVVCEAWKSADYRERTALVKFKIHSTDLAIRKWNKDVFDFFQSRVNDLERKIQMLRGQYPMEMVFSEERKMQLELNEWRKRVKILWR